MNKLFVFIIGVVSVLTSGCLALSGDYTQKADIISTNSKTKYDITFSVDYNAFPPADDTVVLTPHANASTLEVKERCIEWIKDYLEASGAFNSVSYRDFSAKSKYHICFYMFYCPPEDSGSAAIGILSLGLIPIYQDEYYDFSAVLVLNNDIVCAPSTSERMRIWYWLPYFPALVYPPVFVRKNIEKKSLRYLINEIIESNNELIANPPKKDSVKTGATRATSGKTSSGSSSSTKKTTSSSTKIKTE